jgi:sarcosine oxidase
MGSTDAKVAVIGTGTMGSMALWRLSQRTSHVIGFDAQHPGSDRTGVGGDTRLFRFAYREGAFYSELLALSERLFHELNAAGVAALQQYGGLSIGAAEGDYITELLSSVRASGVEHELLDHDELTRRYPQHALLPDDVGIFDPRSGVIRTDEAVLGAVRLATAQGATVATGETVLELIHHADAVEVVTDAGSYRVQKVVLTAGAWSTALLPAAVGTALTPRRVALTWFPARDPAQYTPERFPIFVRESGGVHLFGAPSIDGGTVKVSGMFADDGVADPSRLERSLSSIELAIAHRSVDRFLPGLVPACVRADTYPDLYTPDKHPIVGYLPGSRRLYVATGFSGRGFKMAAGIGEVIARELLGEAPGVDIEFARPERFAA